MIMKLGKYINITFLKFIGVGVVNTVFGTAVMLVLYNCLNCGYWFSTAANYLLGSILSFFLNKNFTFHNKDKSLKVVVKFVINICTCYIVSYGLAQPLIRMILNEQEQNIQDNASMFLGVVFFTFLNYIGQKIYVFKKVN